MARRARPDLARELQEFVVSRLPVFKRPRWVEFVDELPKTATGKLQRYKLRELGNKDQKLTVPFRMFPRARSRTGLLPIAWSFRAGMLRDVRVRPDP